MVRITISPWRFDCLWLFSIPFARFGEEPTHWVHPTPAGISNIQDGKKLSDHSGVVDFPDQHYQQDWPVPAGIDAHKIWSGILTNGRRKHWA